MNVNTQYAVDMMKKYLEIPSPSGYTMEAIKEVKKDFEEFGLETCITNKGALIATMRGQDDEEHVMITAHIDTLGGMVKEIMPDGKLKYFRVGGGCWNAVEGENCTVITRHGKKIRGAIIPTVASSHVNGLKAYESKRDDALMRVRLDEKVFNKEDVKALGINVGDFIVMDTRTEITDNGFIKTRYIDNKSAVGMVLEICRYMRENGMKPKNTTHFFISNYEECGHGVAGVPPKTKEVVAIDIGTVGPGQESSEYAVSIAARDNKTPYDFGFRNRLVNIAEENDIDYKVDVYNSYSSDATQLIHSSIDINFACVGPGVDATHHYERTHTDAIENTIKLLINYLK